ncbi:TVP38/TMEM64 family protein [Acidaminobacter sp. JC074]|uniref:TVP38/TMEM64 family protein n=1 Tax=Acidaminobacter sp. JC074 TaxID=2530199 RepID=UPI001F0F82B2|nr:TVP38/TMEM64 family protein [Acidaminobacter sp. JC074]MCH4891366.1 TVP38/TMEM64 family protein [Acidaminobacter sp. JC074]
MNKNNIMNIATVFGLILCIAFMAYCYSEELFTSEEKMNTFLAQFGVYSIIVFIVIQAVSVVIPILPGSLGCLVGVIFYGPIFGFIYNYVGIALGSLIAFLLSRRYGSEIVKRLTKPKDYDKYKRIINNLKNFDKWFAFMIFIPIAPDDLLCYLAGLTKITFKKYTSIILLMKPFSIATYSFGLNAVFNQLITM